MLEQSCRRGREAEAAARIVPLMRREFGLSPTRAVADLCGSVLRVTLTNAVSPLGRLAAQTPSGAAALEAVYATLHAANRERLHSLIAGIVGVPVQSSFVEADLPTADVVLTFQLLDPSAGTDSFM